MDGYHDKEESSGVYSQQEDGRDISASGGSGGSTASTGSTNGSLFTRPSLTLAQLLNHLPSEVRNTTWEVRNELAKHLNERKDPVGNDWRLVASRLGFRVATIDGFARTDSPTMEMLKLCDTNSTEELFKIIQNINRFDVIEDLLGYFSHSTGSHYSCLPTQESLDDEKSSLSHPLEESGSDISRLKKQPSEQEDDREERRDDVDKFIHSEESKNFWMRISGSDSQKKWPDFLGTMNKDYPEESNHGGIDKLLCHVFKINYDERQDGVVRLDFFSRLLAFFGPFKSGDDGCLKKMYDLILKSVSKSMDGKKHSWFAGYMNKQETEDRLNKETPGTFIVRFSGSRVEEGWFVLAVKTREDVRQIEIEKDTINNKLLLAGECFPDLLVIVDKLRREVILRECRQLLINPCPDLPLNAIFFGYTKVTRNRGRGRGRGRGRLR